MIASRKKLAMLTLIASAAVSAGAAAQIEVPQHAASAGRDTTTHLAPIRLVADLSARTLKVKRGDETIKTFDVAVGQDRYPTPRGSFEIRKIVWNPSWHPPDSKWAQGKSAKGPGDPGNPMKVVKMFFKEPDFYIHGTDDVDSLGEAASHGCLRMDPDEVADLAKIVMTEGGQPREENWFWRIIHFRRESKVVYLDNPVPLTITD
ncbi:MAG TPA: L,D-transpeptidase [Gemmatimonadaceae bacterium]|nr:L,D-transpeptidase [Gemmatimonadaceae bacterium]